MNTKIVSLELENVKRVKAVSIDCEGAPLTVIGGRNGQGKSSVLDAIAWAVGGDRFRPSNPVREGADEAYVKVTLDNGITVERKGVNGSLKVTGGKGGQALLNEFINTFALNLPKFMAVSDIEKARMLLDCFPGLGTELQRLNAEAKRIFDERHALGVIADRKAKYASELPYDPSAPDAPLSGKEMAKRMQDALSHNARNQAVRMSVKDAEETAKNKGYRVDSISKRVADLSRQLGEAKAELEAAVVEASKAQDAIETAKTSAADLKDMDTTAIQAELEKVDSINAKVRSNESKKAAEDEANTLKGQYSDMTYALEKVRADRIKLLSGVEMPLAGLTIGDAGELIYDGQPWDCISGSQQYRVAVAICAAVNPKCGFVLVDKLESMDSDTLREFGDWLTSRNLQVIGTRVGTGADNSIVIEDGCVAGAAQQKDTKYDV